MPPCRGRVARSGRRACLGAPTGAPGHVVQRPQHRGHVAQRRVEAAPVLDRSQRLALEVDHAVPVVCDQHLAQVEVARGCASRSARWHGLEPREAGGDLRRLGPKLVRELAVDAGDGGDRGLSWRVASMRQPAARRGRRRAARGPAHPRAATRAPRGARRQDPEVLGDLRVAPRGPAGPTAAIERRRGAPPSTRTRPRRRARRPGASRPSRRPPRASRPRPSRRGAARRETPPPPTGTRSARGRG